MQIDSELRAKLMTRVVHDSNGCWRWQGNTCPDTGYARIFTGSKKDGTAYMARAHRVAYEAFVGPITSSLDLDHLCRVRDCINPEHLEPVSRAENVLRGAGACAQNARKTSCPRGHVYTRENTLVTSVGGRRCRECNKQSCRKFKADRKRDAL